MEITTVNFHHRKSFKSDPCPLMLKDYLRDDMSSCSSNGFKSFPRRQCCTTVRLLLEIDLKAAPLAPSKRRPRKTCPRPPATASVLQRASVKVLNAMKLLQLHSAKSPSGDAAKKTKARGRRGLLPRSLSRKLWSRSFWRKQPSRDDRLSEGTGRRTSVENRPPPPPDLNAASAVAPHSFSTSSSSSNNRRNSSSWDSSEFAAELARSPGGDPESPGRPNDVVSEDKGPAPRGPHDEKVSDKVGATHGQDSIAATPTCSKQEWSNEEKEQFSPVSVLDCPFNDDEDIASPFEWSPSRIGGAKHKLRHKAHRCKALSRLKPMQLERRIALSELEDEVPVQYPGLAPSPSVLTEVQDDERKIEEKIRELLDVAAGIDPSFTSKVDILLLDFFRERLEEESANKIAIGGLDEFESELLKVAEGWINRQPQEVFLGWEVEDGRHAYIKDMERRERWRNVDEEKMEVALGLEVEVWGSLMDEVLLDIFS